ncbi:MAG: hypothetical protein H6898_09380 [Rhodobacter sp.]|nr:hypothetical protein [Paracoccaceae bacterium]MCC0076781.1 hypothetical protein [Rhodobacter sp.]
MEIAFHLGVHLTDQDQLIRCLMRNRAVLGQQGIAVPGASSYRAQLRQLGQEMEGRPTDATTQEALLDGLIEADDVQRVVFSSEGLLAQHRWAINNNRFYPRAADRVRQLAHLFPAADVRVYLAIRDPASFLPALVADKRSGGLDQALKGSDPMGLRWSEMIARIRAEAPHVPLTIWRDEDTALLWPEILRTVSGHSPDIELTGWFAWYWDLMSPQSHEALRRWFQTNPSPDDLHRRKVLSAMLDKFALPEKIDTDAALPGWDEAYTDVLSELYDQDVDLIAAMEGVTLLEP